MDVPLLIALFTFLTVVLVSSAAFLYLNSREALQTWRRRADGTPSVLKQLAHQRPVDGAVSCSARMVCPNEPALEC